MEIERLERIAGYLRQDVLEMLAESGSGHPGGALGLADIFSALYFHTLKHNPKIPDWEDRDRVVLSPGHVCPLLYATLAESGYFPRAELMTLRKFGSRLQGHPHNTELPGVETSSGSLGQGLSQAIGMALAARMNRKNWRVYAILSDGEHDEGQVWEAIMYAGNKKLNNLVVIVDRNNIQLEGSTEDIMPLEPFTKKYQSFNWQVVEFNGNDMYSVLQALESASQLPGPVCLLAQTTLGKGVFYMENNHIWHGKAPSHEEALSAIKELNNANY